MKKRKKTKTKAKAKKSANLDSIELQFTRAQKRTIEEVAALANRTFEDVCCVMLAMVVYTHRNAVKMVGDELAGPTTEVEAVPEPSPAQADLPAATGASDPAPAVAA